MSQLPNAYTAWSATEIDLFRGGYRVPTERDLKWLEALQAADDEIDTLRRRIETLRDKLDACRARDWRRAN